MEISKFVQGLKSLFTRDELAQSCQATNKKIQRNVLPEIRNLQVLFETHKPKSKEFKLASTACRRETGSTEVFDVLVKALNNSLQTLDMVEQTAIKVFAEEEASAALPFKKATYARLVANVTFVADYSLKLMNWLVAGELGSVDEQHSKAEIEYLEGMMPTYFKVVDSLLSNVASVERMIESLPEVPASERAEAAIISSLGERKGDPLGVNRLSLPIKISVKYNPFYLIATMVADWQVRSYKATEEEVKLLQLRRLRLEKLAEGKNDPKLEQEIEHLSSRVTQLNYELQTAKEKFGV